MIIYKDKYFLVLLAARIEAASFFFSQRRKERKENPEPKTADGLISIVNPLLIILLAFFAPLREKKDIANSRKSRPNNIIFISTNSK